MAGISQLNEQVTANQEMLRQNLKDADKPSDKDGKIKELEEQVGCPAQRPLAGTKMQPAS